jgi:hypothetical protein
MKTLGVEPAGTPGADLPKRITDEIATYRGVAKASGMEPQ